MYACNNNNFLTTLLSFQQPHIRPGQPSAKKSIPVNKNEHHGHSLNTKVCWYLRYLFSSQVNGIALLLLCNYYRQGQNCISTSWAKMLCLLSQWPMSVFHWRSRLVGKSTHNTSAYTNITESRKCKFQESSKKSFRWNYRMWSLCE